MKKRTLTFLILIMTWIFGLSAHAATLVPTDVSTAGEECTLLGMSGKYIVEAQKALKRINEIRYEACKEGVRNPSTGKKLTTADYVEIKWSSDLEYIARIRAAESSLTMAHVRTNGESWYAISSPNGVSSSGEVIAWNWSESMVQGIEQWYAEKKAWVQNTGGVTGHYTAMINPSNRYIGLGTFCSENTEYYNTTVGEFSRGSGLNETVGAGISDCIQTLEFSNSYLSGSYTLSGSSSSVKKGNVVSYKLVTGITMTDSWGEKMSVNGLTVLSPLTWSSSNPSIASVDANGQVLANSCGTAVIKARVASSGQEGSTTLTVNHTWDSGTVTREATCLTAGEKRYTCLACGQTKTESIAKLKAKMKLSATSLKLRTGQKTTAFRISGMGTGDYVKSVKSNKKNILQVKKYSKDGAVTLEAQKKTGSAKLTVELKSGLKKTITVSVQKGTVRTTNISGVQKKVTLKKGKKTTLTPVVVPITSQEKVTYSTSNKKIATVSAKGVITAKKAGTAKITVKSGSKKVTVTVKVTK
jgi:uncharacterized protein YjdB